MAGGIYWGDALRARGLFAQASDGKRLGYHEDLGRQSQRQPAAIADVRPPRRIRAKTFAETAPPGAIRPTL
jgi:hypothetical protein